MTSYSAALKTSVPATQVYKAITEEMSDWWASMDGQFLNLGDQAKTDFGGQSYWSFEASVLDEPERIELICHDANHIHEGLSDGIREEWLGTKLIFQITVLDGETRIDFTHEGLVQELECFQVCKAGWDHYFLRSLKDYLERK
tara:strand:+ start:428 stop:856 length:429 start_codon:yes stop_codon:yes gene_type:complete